MIIIPPGPFIPFNILGRRLAGPVAEYQAHYGQSDQHYPEAVQGV